MRDAQELLGPMENLPEVLFDDVVDEQCAIFAGAGLTTEAGRFASSSFFEAIKRKCNYPKKLGTPTFPDLMEYFCKHVDGGQRNRLIREAIARIEMFSTPGEIHHDATALYTDLAEIPFFNRFVTTNWDPFLEQSLNILVPMVEDRDLAFWDDTKRQVLKIHGCITRPYTLVATRDDYETCIKQNRLVFNKLRDLMATKTFIFVGYSLRDPDFQLIHDEIESCLGRFRKLSYAFDPLANEAAIKHWKTRGIEVTKTYPIAFVRALREHLEAQGLVPPRRFLRFLASERRRIAGLHVKINQNEEGGIASAMYQDGLLHALTEVLSGTALGKKKDYFEKELVEKERTVREMRQKMDIVEVAYYSGWREVFAAFCSRSEAGIPSFFHPRKSVPINRYVKF